VVNRYISVIVIICLIMFISCFSHWVGVPPIFIPDMSLYDILNGALSKNGRPSNYAIFMSIYMIIPIVNIAVVLAVIITNDAKYCETIRIVTIISIVLAMPFALTLYIGPIIYALAGLGIIAILSYASASCDKS